MTIGCAVGCLCLLLGLAFAFGFCVDCCACEDCCNGSAPEEFEATIPLTDPPSFSGLWVDGCSYCNEFLGGTFILSRVPDSYSTYGSCTWEFEEGPTPCGPPDCHVGDWLNIHDCRPTPNNQTWFVARKITLKIRCVSATQYRVLLEYEAYRRKLFDAGTWTEHVGMINNYWSWEQTVNHSAFDCTTAASFALPQSAVAGGPFTGPWCNESQNIGADALITAL